MADKVLSFSISIDGVSNEATELAKLEIQLKNIKKERDALIKQASQPGHIASNEEKQKLAAYNTEITKQDANLKNLKKTVDTAADSLDRKRAKLIELTKQYAAGGAAIESKLLPEIKQLRAEIDRSETAIGNHQRNVGNYPELFSQIPGPVGRAASSMRELVEKIKMFGPVGALIGGGLVAISAPLVAFFTKSEKGVELLERKVAGFKGAMSVLGGELIGLGDKMTEAFDKPDTKAKRFWTTLMTLISPAWADVGIRMDIASAAMER
jgi:hypothetical protein